MMYPVLQYTKLPAAVFEVYYTCLKIRLRNANKWKSIISNFNKICGSSMGYMEKPMYFLTQDGLYYEYTWL